MISTLIDTLRTLNVKLDVIDGRLDIQAAKGVIDNALAREIKFNKEELMRFVKSCKSNRITYFGIEPVGVRASYPLSSAQRRLWILSQFEQESVAYNMPSHVVLPGTCNLENLKKAIDSTIERHEILRTVFREDETGEVRQLVLSREALNFQVDYHDFSSLPDGQRQVQRYLHADAAKPFDLAAGPLLRAAILQVAADQTVFYYNMHHIISDGWSMNVLTKDVMHFYEAYNASRVPGLAPLKIQYKDYAEWQLKKLAEPPAKAHRNYWLNLFSGELPAFDLPSRKKRPLFKTNHGRNLGTYFSPETSAALKKFCQERDSSLFIGLLAITNALFSRYTSQRAFVVGTPMAGRNHVDLENQIGFYVNTIALLNHVAPDESGEQFFARVRKTTFEAYEHQQYPFDRLVEDLMLKRDTSRSPLFDVMLILQNVSDPAAAPQEAATGDVRDLGEEVSKYDLCFLFQETGDQLSLQVTYNTDIYEEEMIARFMRHYQHMTRSLIENPGLNVQALNYLSPDEQQALLCAANGTKADYLADKTTIDLFEEQVAQTPAAVAVICRDRQLSYRQLDERAAAYAAYLSGALGVRSEDRVIVSLPHDHHLMAVLLAVMKVGAVYVPVDPKTPQERLRYIQADSRSVTVIDWDVLLRMEAAGTEHAGAPAVTRLKRSDIETVIYTSGSTGVPKGVLIKSAGVMNRLHWMWKNYPFAAGEVCCAKTSIGFVDHIWELYGPLLQGVPLVFYKKEELLDVPRFIESLHHHQVSRIVLVPTLLRELLSYPELSRERLQHLRLWISSGEALKRSDVEKFYATLRSSQVRLLNIYGCTEVTADATYYDTYEEYNSYKDFKLFQYSIRQEVDQLVAAHDASDRIIARPFEELLRAEDFAKVSFESALSTQEYLSFVRAQVMPNVVNVGVTSFVGHMTSLIPNIFRELTSLVVAINQNQVKIETSMVATLIEKQVIGIFHHLVYGKDEPFYRDYVQAPNQALGVITNGGTMSNVMALSYALNNLLGARNGFRGIAKEGLVKALRHYGYEGVVLLGSSWCHYSFNKTLKLLGLGTEAFVAINFENKQEQEIREELGAVIGQLREQRQLILGIVGVAGATESGNIDPLELLGSVAAEYDIHYHVDAAFGGSFLVDDAMKQKFRGIQRADSVSICAHKQFYLPIGLSVCLFNDPSFALSSENNTHYQARKGSYDLGKFTIEGSRNFMSLVLHAAFRIFGKEGFAEIIRHNYRTAQTFAGMIGATREFELLYKPDLNIVLYRYIPVALRGQASFTDAELEEINAINRQIQEEQFKRGNTFVSYTQIKRNGNATRHLAFRTVLMNPFTSVRELEIMLAEQKAIADGIENLPGNGCEEAKSDNILIGKPIENVNAYILDEDLNILSVGVTGEICIGGDCVAAGYVNESGNTDHKFVANPYRESEKLYRTGDLGRRMADGNIEYVGRKDDMVKIYGNRVELGEIEHQLKTLAGVREAVVLVRESTPGDRRLVAYVVAARKLLAADMRNYLAQRIPGYMIPSHFVQLDELPLTLSGKVNKKGLADPAALGPDPATVFVAPGSQAEKEVIALAELLLQKEHISLKDNFYNVGGDSIKLIQLLSHLRKRGYAVTPEQILKALDFEALAGVLQPAAEASGQPEQPLFPQEPTAYRAGDQVAISENQQHMMRFRSSQAVIGPIRIPVPPKEALETEFRRFLGHFPELHLRFRQEQSAIHQQRVSADEVSLTTCFRQIDIADAASVKQAENEMQKQPYDFLHGELIRLFVFTDERGGEKGLLYLTISHALADLHTSNLLNQALVAFLHGQPIGAKTPGFSSMHYAEWQRNYLASEAGKTTRKCWLDYLLKAGLAAKYPETERSTDQLLTQRAPLPVDSDYIEQRVTVTGEKFELLKKLAEKLNTSVAAVCMAYHQLLLQGPWSVAGDLQMVLVNGREGIAGGIEASGILGVLNNTLPLPVLPSRAESFPDYCRQVQVGYLEARQYQAIPYEVIRKDFLDHTNVDVDLYKKGYFNFQQLEGRYTETTAPAVEVADVQMDREVFLDMTCRMKENGIQISFLYKKAVSDKQAPHYLTADCFLNELIKRANVL